MWEYCEVLTLLCVELAKASNVNIEAVPFVVCKFLSESEGLLVGINIILLKHDSTGSYHVTTFKFLLITCLLKETDV
jgi:hypothetical protein